MAIDDKFTGGDLGVTRDPGSDFQYFAPPRARNQKTPGGLTVINPAK